MFILQNLIVFYVMRNIIIMNDTSPHFIVDIVEGAHAPPPPGSNKKFFNSPDFRIGLTKLCLMYRMGFSI